MQESAENVSSAVQQARMQLQASNNFWMYGSWGGNAVCWIRRLKHLPFTRLNFLALLRTQEFVS